MKTLVPSQSVTNLRHQHQLVDDFIGFTDTSLWTETSPDTGATVALDADGIGGVIQLTTGATDNNEAYLESNEIAKFAASKPIHLEALVQYTEANTDDANILVGLMDAPGADSLLDNGAGPKASYSGAVFFKVDGGTKWNVESSIAGTQTTTETDVTAGGSAQQRLEIDVYPTSSTSADIVFKIDGRQCRDSGGTAIKHTVSIASATEMAIAFGVKAGGANSEVLNVDYVAFRQKR